MAVDLSVFSLEDDSASLSFSAYPLLLQAQDKPVEEGTFLPEKLRSVTSDKALLSFFSSVFMPSVLRSLVSPLVFVDSKAGVSVCLPVCLSPFVPFLSILFV